MKKVALITGASSGIGAELAKVHAEKGGDLVIVARRESKLIELKNELESAFNINVKVIAKDLNGADAARELYEQVRQEGIEIDYLINNAGFGGRGKFHERKWEEDLAMINLNVVALTALTRFFLDDFVKRDSGKILNVSSTASLAPGPLQAVYFATKAFVTFFSNALNSELDDTNVSVTALLPGATETEFAKVSGMDKSVGFQKTFSAYGVAKDGYEGMLKGKMDVISGLTSMQKVMLSFIPLTPKKIIIEQMKKFNEVPQ